MEIIWSDIEELALKNVSALIENAEYNFNRQIYDIAENIYNDSKISLILLAGPSASGKTTSANILAKRLERKGVKVHRISTDDYYLNHDEIPFLENGLKDYDSLRAINVERLQSDIKNIMDVVSFVPPEYDFKSGMIHDGTPIMLSNQDVVIIEGIHALNPALTILVNDKLDKIKKISIVPRRAFRMPYGGTLEPNELRLLRRLIRDYYTRGYSFSETLKQWSEVRRAEDVYIKPYVQNADYFIDSVYDYELIVYKQCIYNTIKDSPIEALKNIRMALACVKGMKIETIPTMSLLNEFVHYGDLT